MNAFVAHFFRYFTAAGASIRRTLKLAVAASPSVTAGPARLSTCPGRLVSAGGPIFVPASTHTPSTLSRQGGQAPESAGAGGRHHIEVTS